MLCTVFLLKPRCLNNFVAAQEDILADSSKYPPYSFKIQEGGHLINQLGVFIHSELNVSDFSMLRWLIYGFDNRPYTFVEVWIFSIVTIKNSSPLNRVSFRSPKLDELLGFFEVGKLGEINMSIALLFEDN
jgi:hypothetical protein